MIKKLSFIFITAGAILLPIILCATLVFALPYFTVYSHDDFASGVSSYIDENKLAEIIKPLIATTAETYGHNADIISGAIDNTELKNKAGEYFTQYYNSFITGERATIHVKYRNNAFYYAIKENAPLSSRPEYFEVDENSLLLATRCNNLVESSINSLSLDSAYSVLLSYREAYLRLAGTGKYFTPLALASSLLFIILLVFIVKQKRYKTSYVLSLVLFAGSILFSIPLTYVCALDLPAKLNISVGAAYCYIDALYKYIFERTSYIYIAISAFLLVLFILSVVWTQTKKNSNK